MLLLAAIVFVLASSTTVAISRGADDDPARRFSPLLNLGGLDHGDPNRPIFVEGHQVTLAEAERTFPAKLYRPQHELVSDASLTEVWVGTLGDLQIGLKYASGVRAYVALWPASRVGDAEASYREDDLESEWATYEEIGGDPAIVVPADAQIPGADGVVKVTFGRVEVSIYGQLDRGALIDVAETIQERRSRRGSH